MNELTIVRRSFTQQISRSLLQKKRSGVILLWLLCSAALSTAPTLSQPLAEGKDKFLGASTSSNLSRYFTKYWNQVTPGNDGKWGSVEPIQDRYNWTNLDKIYNFALNHNLLFKEHALVWGQQQPYWIGSLDSAAQRAKVEEWIRKISERYPEMSFVDVVNEPLHAPPVYASSLGGNGATGWDWIITAFELARQNCPADAKLILNEYNILHSNSVTNNYIEIINLLKDRELIDGIGIQGHYFEFRSDMNATSNIYVYDINTIKSNLDRLSETGVPIYVTEFDIDEPIDANQLQQYQIYFPIFWNHPAVKGITFWGYIQDDVWTSHPNTYLLLSNGTERPTLQWMRSYIASPLPPAVISPDAAGSIVRDPILSWHASESAISYNVQLATSIAFSSASIVADTTVADTLLQVGPLDANRRYYWHVSATNDAGTSFYSTMAAFMTGEYFTSVENRERAPFSFALYPNYPNPFNPATTISFHLPQKDHVRLVLLNLLGEEVKKIVEGDYDAGVHQVQLNASDLASGIYFYKIKASNHFSATEKLILMK